MYKRIIDEVINASHVTFEEDGVEQQTLEDVRSVGYVPCLHSLSPAEGLWLQLPITCPSDVSTSHGFYAFANPNCDRLPLLVMLALSAMQFPRSLSEGGVSKI